MECAGARARVCGSTHRESYFDIVMDAIAGALLALAAAVL